MLPNDQSHQSNVEQDVDGDVKECVRVLVEEFYGVLQHVTLEFYFVYVYA